MVTQRISAGLTVGIFFAAITVIAAQSATVSNSDISSPQDALLAEVRGLRTDFQQAAKVSVRTQLLVARLQLQEQRISVVGTQLVEVRRRLSANQSAQIPVVNDLNRVEEYLRTKTFSAEDQKQIEYSVEMNKSKLALARKEEQELRAQETDLANQLATEQSQWVDFNARLDALEQQLPVSQR